MYFIIYVHFQKNYFTYFLKKLLITYNALLWVTTNKKTLFWVSFLFSGFLSVPHSDSLPFACRFAPPKGLRYLLLHKWLTTFWVSLRSSKMCSLLIPGSPGRIENNEQKKQASLLAFLVQRLSILPGRFQPSTFDVCELNYRVRHGYGCILTAIATVSESVLSKLYRRIFHLRFLKVF